MQRIRLSETLDVSRIIHGHMRMHTWGYNDIERLRFIEELYTLGITTIDTADIYGNYQNETLLGNALDLNKTLRNNLQIITKCGIIPKGSRYPERLVKHYDLSYEHIIKSVENSLKRMRTDYIDLLLIHRPSPFTDYEAVTKAFNQLYKEGKVLNFGVSNFKQFEFNTMQKYLKFPIVTNQIEVSPLNLEHFKDGTIDLCLEYEIPPMVYSPLAGGTLMTNDDYKSIRIRRALEIVSKRHNGLPLDVVIYAWILNHPANFMPVVGSGKLERIKLAKYALNVKITTEEWFLIYEAALGFEVL